jgi:hypothetical protein
MKRINIYITEQQIIELLNNEKIFGLTMSEQIRRGIDLHLEKIEKRKDKKNEN